MLLRPTTSSSNLSGQLSPKPRHDCGVESRRFLQLRTVKGQQTGQNPAQCRHHLDRLLLRRQTPSRGDQAALPYSERAAFMARLRAINIMSRQARLPEDGLKVFCVSLRSDIHFKGARHRSTAGNRKALDKQSKAEEGRWEKQKEKLQSDLLRARK
jgi:hypothetical protein